MDRMKPNVPESEVPRVGQEVARNMGAVAVFKAPGRPGETVEDFVLPKVDVSGLTLEQLIEAGMSASLAEGLLRPRNPSDTTAGWNSAV